MTTKKKMKVIATCAAGLEELLVGELRELDLEPDPGRGAVKFTGGWADVWRANWRLRTANRVLVEIARWRSSDGGALVRGARNVVERGVNLDGVPSVALFDPDRTLAVRATTRGSSMKDTRWVALKVKDGIVDGQRARTGRRSSIDRTSPDLALRVHVSGNEVRLLLDTSGESLDRRGYRVRTTSAPVREQLAAAMILATGWDGQGPVVDPMCGSGTMLVEAGWIAAGIAPGALRLEWAFERLPGFDPRRFEAIRNEPLKAPDPKIQLLGADISGDALISARKNLDEAGLGPQAKLVHRDAYEFEPMRSKHGLVTINPPYGERLEEEPEQWRRLGDLLKQRYAGWTAVVLAGGETRGKPIGLKPRRRWPVRNGPLEARMLVFDLY